MTTQNIFDLVDTWNAGATTFTAVKMNVTNTASAAASLLMDLQIGSVSAFNVSKGGSLKLGLNTSGTNVAASNVIISGPQGTGSGAGGSIVFQVAPAGGGGASQNTLVDALTIGSNRVVTVAANASSLAQIAMADRGTVLSIYASAFGVQPLLVSAPGGLAIDNNTGAFRIGASQDVQLHRDATGVLGLRGSSTTTAGAMSFYTYGASPPAAPAASIVRLYADTSGGKIRLMAIFPSGVAQQIAIEP
jgi:hypothetical protein